MAATPNYFLDLYVLVGIKYQVTSLFSLTPAKAEQNPVVNK